MHANSNEAANTPHLHTEDEANAPFYTMITWMLVLGFMVIMTLHPFFSTLNLDRHGDMVENYAWGMNWQWGYFKHPPFFAAVTAAWFEIFPRSNFWHFALSAISAGAALLVIWRIALHYLSRQGAFLAVAIGICLPPLFFLAIKYNANSAMTPLWAAIFLFYLRTIDKPNLLNGTLLGLFSGLAMLTKYYSVVLILSLVLHALMEKQLRPLLISPAFGVAIVAFFAVTLPHFIWLLDNQFLSINYAASQGQSDLSRMITKALEFPLALVLYCLPGYLLLLAMWRRGDHVMTNMLAPFKTLRTSLKGRALLTAITVSLILTYVLAFLSKADLTAVWALPLYFTIPIIMAAQVPQNILRVRWKSAAFLCLAFLSVTILVSPAIYALNLSRPTSYNLLPVRSIALEAEKVWRAKSRSKGEFYVAGTQVIANGMSFYAKSRVMAIQVMSLRATPWASRQEINKKGLLVLCLDHDQACINKAQTFVQKIDFEQMLIVPAFKDADGPKSYKLLLYGQLPVQ